MTELEVLRERLEKIAALAGRPIRIDGLEERVGRLEVALRLVLDKLTPVREADDGGIVSYRVDFNPTEAKHLAAFLWPAEGPP